MRGTEEVHVELSRGARCCRQLAGSIPLGVGDILAVPGEGLVRIHYISSVSGDAFYRPLTLTQRVGYYWRKTVRWLGI